MSRRRPGGSRRITYALAALVALVGLACAGAPKPVGPDLYVVKRVGRITAPSWEVAASAASKFCEGRGRVMKPDFEQTESGPWGEPITELTFRCLFAEGLSRR